MSYYYSYYIGYKKDGKIYPLGPYNSKGKLKPVLCKSRSFASDLHNRFSYVRAENMSEELANEFTYKDWNGEPRIEVKYLLEEDLTDGSFIKTGYFPISSVRSYLENGDCDTIKYDMIKPEIYSAKLQNEIMFGKNQPKKDGEGYEYTELNASDYMYFSYIDKNTEEFESFMLRSFLEEFKDYDSGVEYLILETEG